MAVIEVEHLYKDYGHKRGVFDISFAIQRGEVHWLRVVEDVKSEATKTRVYAIKRKLMRERLGIDVREV